MLISFEATDEELSGQPEPEIEELFSELLRASRRGYHFVLIDRRTSDWGLNNLTLNNREKAHLEALKSGFTQRGQLRRQAEFQLQIGLGSFGLEKRGKVYTIGHIALLRGEYLEKSILLVENAEGDGELIKNIFYTLRRSHPVKDYSVEIRHGGGSTIVPVFDDLMRTKRITVCVADSDRVSPLSPDSSTVKALSKTAQLQTFVGALFVTLCREIENHLPFELIRKHKVCPQYPDFDKLAHLIQNQQVAKADERLWLSFDVKKGFVGAALDTKNHSDEVRQWLEANFCQGQLPSTWNVAGFGEAVLGEFMKSGPAMSEFALHVHTEDWRCYFGDFFDEMLWFFAAEKKIATR